MIKKRCLVCKKEFSTFPSAKGKFCSRECYSLSLVGKNHGRGDKISKAKMGHGWPEGYHERQSLAQKKRFKSGVPWNKGMSLIGILSDEKSGVWKGDLVGRKALHGWVKRRLTNPHKCSFCGVLGRMELSNVSGNYMRDLDDWQWLCAKCHRNYDQNSKKAWITRKELME